MPASGDQSPVTEPELPSTPNPAEAGFLVCQVLDECYLASPAEPVVPSAAASLNTADQSKESP